MATKKKTAAPAEARNAVTAVIALNVRKDPEDGSAIVGVIRGRGVPLRIAEEKTGWCRMANGLGWVRKEYIEYI